MSDPWRARFLSLLAAFMSMAAIAGVLTWRLAERDAQYRELAAGVRAHLATDAALK